MNSVMITGDSRLSVEGFVDIHVHILPGLDDGAKPEGGAIAMATVAAKRGTSKIVAMTPDLVGYLTRGEVMPVSDRGKYVLVELPFQTIPSYAEEEVFNMAASGYIPIIAHPERNASVIRNPNVLIPFLKAGALAHVNAGSLMGREGHRPQETAEILLRHGLAHIIASDGHSATSRQPGLDRAFEIASRLLAEDEALKTVRDIPLAIVHGEDAHVNEPEVYKARRKWWRFPRREGS